MKKLVLSLLLTLPMTVFASEVQDIPVGKQSVIYKRVVKVDLDECKQNLKLKKARHKEYHKYSCRIALPAPKGISKLFQGSYRSIGNEYSTLCNIDFRATHLAYEIVGGSGYIDDGIDVEEVYLKKKEINRCLKKAFNQWFGGPQGEVTVIYQTFE